MDNPPRPEEGYTNAGCYSPVADASYPKTYDETYEAALQTAEQNLKYLINKELNRNASMSPSDGSARANQAMFETCNWYENSSSSINLQGSFLSSSLDVSREFDISAEFQNHSVPYGKGTVSTVPTHNWNRSASNNRMTTEINQAHKRTRSVISGRNGKGLSTGSEQKSINENKALDIYTACQRSSDWCFLDGIDHKIQTSKQTVSNSLQNPILIKMPWSIEQNIASNTNISDMSRREAPSEISHSIPFKIESIRSADNIFAFPGPSGFNRNVYSTNISGDTLQPCIQSKKLSVKRNGKKASICNVCRSEIFKHAYKDGGKFFYECCICDYSSSKKAGLQMHSDTHLLKICCNVCQKEHMEGNSHDGEHKCAACKQTFYCKTELNEHILEHNNYFFAHCWSCSKNFKDHFIEEENVEEYVCCVCSFKGEHSFELRKHNDMHRPKNFCRICKEEYHKGQEVLHNREFMCDLCQQTFLCQPMLEDHTKDNQEYFHLYCRVCNKKINAHKIETEKMYYCCKCSKTFNREYDLQQHLYIHTYLNLFKCYKCGKRFRQKEALTDHSESCPAVPYKCEICHARFPRKDFFDLHCSVKHKKV